MATTNKKLKNILKVNIYGKTRTLRLVANEYQLGGLYVGIEVARTREPYCDLTVCLGKYLGLMPDEAYVDTNNVMPELVQAIVDAGYMTLVPGHERQSGWYTYPLYKFTLAK